MKKISKILLALIITLSTIFSSTMSTFAYDRNKNQEINALVSKIISFYRNGYTVDVIKHLNDLKTVSPENHEIWSSVIDYLDWIEMDMIENIDVAPDGLVNDKIMYSLF